MTTQRGFSAIEALVALVIIAIALVPIIGLQIQATRSHAHNAELLAQATAQRNALAVLREINPMQEPSGARQLSAAETLQWRAAPLSRVSRSVGDGVPDGSFDVALYRLDAEVTDARGRAVTAFSVEQVGFRRRSDAGAVTTR